MVEDPDQSNCGQHAKHCDDKKYEGRTENTTHYYRSRTRERRGGKDTARAHEEERQRWIATVKDGYGYLAAQLIVKLKKNRERDTGDRLSTFKADNILKDTPLPHAVSGTQLTFCARAHVHHTMNKSFTVRGHMTLTATAVKKPHKVEIPTTLPPSSKASGKTVFAIMASMAPPHIPSMHAIIFSVTLLSLLPGGKATAPTNAPKPVKTVMEDHIKITSIGDVGSIVHNTTRVVNTKVLQTSVWQLRKDNKTHTTQQCTKHNTQNAHAHHTQLAIIDRRFAVMLWRFRCFWFLWQAHGPDAFRRSQMDSLILHIKMKEAAEVYLSTRLNDCCARALARSAKQRNMLGPHLLCFCCELYACEVHCSKVHMYLCERKVPNDCICTLHSRANSHAHINHTHTRHTHMTQHARHKRINAT